MRAILKPSEALSEAVRKVKVPDLICGTHAEIIAEFEYQLAYKALKLFGVQTKDAEWMASHEKGNARTRYFTAIRKLQR